MSIENSDEFHSLYEKERIKVDKKIASAVLNRKPASLYLPASYILKSGGKRLRPLLVLFSNKVAGGKTGSVYNASVAVELLHNFTLVHDDIMDNADKRRGRPTLHKKYDDSTAILVGDSLLSIAYEYLLKDCNGNAKEIITAFNNGLVEVCEGQSMDKDFESLKNVSLNQYRVMITKKTAALIETCCYIGAKLAGASDDKVKALSSYGKNLGIAFQIEDDLLDIAGVEKEFGKITGGDLIEGKKTYLFLKALELAKGNDRKKLLTVIKNKGIDKSEVMEYKKLYDKLGVLKIAAGEIQRYTRKALRYLRIFNKEERELLTWLANSLIKRSR